jgi:PEP-CTERM motif-containing protein
MPKAKAAGRRTNYLNDTPRAGSHTALSDPSHRHEGLIDVRNIWPIWKYRHSPRKLSALRCTRPPHRRATELERAALPRLSAAGTSDRRQADTEKHASGRFATQDFGSDKRLDVEPICAAQCSGDGEALLAAITASTVSGVPEPSGWAMMVLGFAGLCFAFRQSPRRSRSSEVVVI